MNRRRAVALAILGGLVFIIPNLQSLRSFFAGPLIVGAVLSAVAVYASTDIDNSPKAIDSADKSTQ